ncbi:hypothetical protein LINPERHAP2_LOCUS26838, partial [Linum perenne]
FLKSSPLISSTESEISPSSTSPTLRPSITSLFAIVSIRVCSPCLKTIYQKKIDPERESGAKQSIGVRNRNRFTEGINNRQQISESRTEVLKQSES